VTNVLLNVALMFATALATFRLTAFFPARLATRQLLHALLACNSLSGSFSRSRIGPGSLAANRQMRTVPHASVTTNILQARNIGLDRPAKLTLDLVVPFNDGTYPGHLFLGEFFGLDPYLNAGFFEDIEGIAWPDAVNVPEGEFHPLVRWYVHTRYTWHVVSS